LSLPRGADSPGRTYGLLLLAVLFISLGSIFVRVAQAPPLAVSFFRILFATALVAPAAATAAWPAWRGLARRERWSVAGAGVALALHFATWIASLSYTSVAASVLLVNTAPLFTMALAPLLLREPVARVLYGAGALAMAGAALIALDDWGQGQSSLLGFGLALAGAVTLSLYHVAGRALRVALPLSVYLLAVWGTAAATLLALAVAFGTDLGPFPLRTWAAFLGLAAFPTLAGHGLVNRALRHLPAPRVGLFLLGEPIGATLLAYLFFGEAPGWLTLAGAVLVLAALALVVRAEEA
jgi:drug/metabolite transporter (DMT)-like permease